MTLYPSGRKDDSAKTAVVLNNEEDFEGAFRFRCHIRDKAITNPFISCCIIKT